MVNYRTSHRVAVRGSWVSVQDRGKRTAQISFPCICKIALFFLCYSPRHYFYLSVSPNFRLSFSLIKLLYTAYFKQYFFNDFIMYGFSVRHFPCTTHQIYPANIEVRASDSDACGQGVRSHHSANRWGPAGLSPLSSEWWHRTCSLRFSGCDWMARLSRALVSQS